MTTNDHTIAGGSTDQHVTGAEEEGSFLTDEPPTSTTPSHGSSNLGINKRRANSEEAMSDDDDRPERD